MKITHLFRVVKKKTENEEEKRFLYKMIKRIIVVKKKIKGFRNNTDDIIHYIEDILDDVIPFFYNVSEDKINETIDYLMYLAKWNKEWQSKKNNTNSTIKQNYEKKDQFINETDDSISSDSIIDPDDLEVRLDNTNKNNLDITSYKGFHFLLFAFGYFIGRMTSIYL